MYEEKVEKRRNNEGRRQPKYGDRDGGLAVLNGTMAWPPVGAEVSALVRDPDPMMMNAITPRLQWV